MISTRAFLKREGYEFNVPAHTLTKRLERILPAERRELLYRAELATSDEKQRLLYELPQNRREALTLMSLDTDRLLASIDWLAKCTQARDYRTIVDLGCGIGSVARYLHLVNPRSVIIGVDRAENLIAIARSMTENAWPSFFTCDYRAIPSIDPIDLFVSVCTIEFLDVSVQQQPDNLAPDQVYVPHGLYQGIRAIIGDALLEWRRKSAPYAHLKVLLRTWNADTLAAFAAVALTCGWRIDWTCSDKVLTKDERFPALTFVADEPADTSLDCDAVLAWKVATASHEFGKDDGAIIGYRNLGAKPTAVKSQLYRDGHTMKEEVGQTSDGRSYRYRYATTGFRELVIG